MAHSFLSLDMNLIPQATKDNVPNFWLQLFSNNGVKDKSGDWITEPTLLLLDGYNKDRELVHSSGTLESWTQWSDNPTQVINSLISTAEEHTKEEMQTKLSDINSIWFQK